MSERLAIIYNPRSGKRTGKDLTAVFAKEFSLSAHQIFIWDKEVTFEELENLILGGKFSHVIAAGGDGTVNRVAKFALQNELILGIIPLGSGNGLARSLAINLDTVAACKQIISGQIKTIDCGRLNNHYFFCTAGVGFDAHVGKVFSSNQKRGFWTYFKIVLKEIFLYKPKLYTIKSKNGEVALEAFLITVANAGQWGNNVYIAPQAKLDDGKLDLIAIKKFSLYSIPNIVFYLANKKINLSKHAFVLYGDSFIIETEEVVNFHCDGEPIAGEKSLEFRIDSRKLKVVC